MTPLQEAEYRASLDRCRERSKPVLARLRRLDADRVMGWRVGLEAHEPPADPRKPDEAEQELADRLRPNLCPDSTVDLDRHALGVARMILQGRRA